MSKHQALGQQVAGTEKELDKYFFFLFLIFVSYNLTHLGLQSMKEWGMGDSLVANVLAFAESVSQNLCEEA